MNQREAVIKAMEESGGYATLGHLYQEALAVTGCKWRTRTPFASIRRIVQDERYFFKIRPGLWALKTCKKNLPPDIFPSAKVPKEKQSEFNHSYYQGLLVEIGNLKDLETFVPRQDKNKTFLGRKLGDIATIKTFYEFGYERMVRKAQTIDVSWFNSRKMPQNFFEVEHSTDFQNSLLKFLELQDFNTGFFIVADGVRKGEYENKVTMEAFTSIRNRINFMSYEQLSGLHSKTTELKALERGFTL